MRNGLASALQISANILRESVTHRDAEDQLDEYLTRAVQTAARSPTVYSCDFMDGFEAALTIVRRREGL